MRSEKNPRSALAMYSSVSLAVLTASISSAAAAAPNCSNLVLLTLPNTTLSSAQSYSAGQTLAPGVVAPVDLCRVVGKATPTAASNINFEVWLPNSNWSGRYQQVGNSGLAGTVPAIFMSFGASKNNVVAGTDDGSSQLPGQPAGLFGQSRDKLEDYESRAVHMTNVNAKALIQAFYGKGPQYSYFTGCSKGGGESHFSAQRHPDDFDGILGGAATNNSTGLITGWALNVQAVQLNTPGFVPAAKVAGALIPAMDQQCKRAKAVPTDRFLSYPDKCRIDFSKLVCTGASNNSCLTYPQINGVKAVLEGPRTSYGRQIAPGYEPDFAGWVGTIINDAQTPPATPTTSQAFLDTAVFSYWLRPPVTLAGFNFDTDWQGFVNDLGKIVDAVDPDLRKFKARGGKMIQYAGLADPQVTPKFAIDYYNSVVDFNRKNRDGRGENRDRNDGNGQGGANPLTETQDFYRLYLVPGMGHCFGGEGPNYFGSFDGGLPGGNPGSDIIAALEYWVEKGSPPHAIVASGTNNAFSPSKPFTRPLCPYPQIAVYTGVDTNDAASFECRPDSDHDQH
ncbi:tannase/feruloyl esterase family alpha/beta hydrolase [Bradyrhizobium manausense]|uniref:tannase/feruloyl esterase family alpha/beta hydrolase n=1 Tax=Bradyrhizobium manausense TaxID=989370 RepID=UPI001BAC0CED|nr:tannase/feruloyl esterase family alpha/beta hydrolase [Bradyrhizobium manausense]MBR0727088.1 tannase/feruloyl esterase family alpha/beta hydrolase [Bradyrhizobium manausense]